MVFPPFFFFFFKVYTERVTSVIEFQLKKFCIELNFFNIEFHVAFFIEKRHITKCYRGCGYLLMELNISEIEFYVKLDFHKIKFQKGGFMLQSLRTVLFCWKLHKLVLFGHFGNHICNIYYHIQCCSFPASRNYKWEFYLFFW